MNALKYVIFQSTNSYLAAWSSLFSALLSFQIHSITFQLFGFSSKNESGRAQLNSHKDLNLFVDWGHLVLSERLRTSGCVAAFMWAVRIIRWFWRPWPLSRRIPVFLCFIDTPLCCYTERIWFLILCCLVTVHSTELQSLQLHFLWCIFQQE